MGRRASRGVPFFVIVSIARLKPTNERGLAMAFVLNCVLDGLEFRGLRSGTGRESGQPWMSLVLEDGDAQQIEVSVPRDMQGDVYSLALRKGDVVDVVVRAVARNDGNSYVQLTALPELADLESESVA